MLNRSIALIAAAAMLASATSAMAGLVGMPMNLKYALESSSYLTHAHVQMPQDSCVLHTDDVLIGPVTAWVC